MDTDNTTMMWDLERLKYAGIRTIVNTSLYVRRSPWLSPTTQPNQVKTYSCRPILFGCRIFTPSGFDGQSKLPLVIRAHGGGFVSGKVVLLPDTSC
jgi:acetyl esterase/lipase